MSNSKTYTIKNLKADAQGLSEWASNKLKVKYQVVQYTNPLTSEIYFYIEQKYFFRWKEWKIESEVYQQMFGCDRDGMFNKLDNVIKVLKFLKGVTKVEKKVVTNISYDNEQN